MGYKPFVSLIFITIIICTNGSPRQRNFNTLEHCAQHFDNLREGNRRNFAFQLDVIYNVLSNLVNTADEEIAQYNALDEQLASIAPWNILQNTPDNAEDLNNVTSQLRDVNTALTRSRGDGDACISVQRMNRQERRQLNRRWRLRWKPRRSPRRLDGTHTRQIKYINLCATDICHISGFDVLPNGDLVAADSDSYAIYIFNPEQDYPRKIIKLAPLVVGDVVYSHEWIVRVHVRLINQEMAWLSLNLLDSTSYLIESEDQNSRRWDSISGCELTDSEPEPEARVEPCADPGYLQAMTTDQFGFTYGAVYTEHMDAIAPNCTRFPSIASGRYDYMVRDIVRFDRNMLYVRTDSRGHRRSSVNNLHVFEIFDLIGNVN
ncbi:uncharacterized protein [Argopecten irradians]|uniref:uncharacterized protein n=1 Tax=Argopecten irradians TaxID=31199 RepID=UPI0037137513